VSRAQDLIQPDVIARASRLELVARETVEGFISGLHRSPFHGLSVEFSQHRNYAYGDDLKHLDWKVFGKTDRFYIKEYEKETNVRVYIAVDASRSMAYGPPGATKYDYASRLAACLAYLMLRQQDAPGLALFNAAGLRLTPPRTSAAQIHNIAHALVACAPEGLTDLPSALTRLAAEAHQKSVVVVISDFFAQIEPVVAALRELRQRRHDTIVFQVIDADETEFPFHHLTRFCDMETTRRVLVEPHFLRASYMREFGSFMETLRTECLNARIDHRTLVTREPLSVGLASYLASRRSGGAR